MKRSEGEFIKLRLLANKRRISRSDFIDILNPNQKTDLEKINQFLQNIPSEEKGFIDESFKLKLIELWEIKENFSNISQEEFLKRFNRIDFGIWIYDKITSQLRHTLSEDDFFAVAFSRAFPLFSRTELNSLRKKHIFFSGLSTGSPVVFDLVGLGLGSFSGVDADSVNLSNVRMRTGDADVGLNKAIYLGHRISQINPFVKMNLYPRLLKPTEIEEIIETSDGVCEMTDTFANKVNIRRLAKKHGKMVFMGSGFGELPSFSFESPNDSMFLRNLKQEDLELMLDPNADSVTKARKAIDIVSLPFLSKRALLNFLLVGKLGYWSQLQSTASVVGGGLAYSIACQITGSEVISEESISLIDKFIPRSAQKKRDQELLEELNQDERFSSMFSKYSDLDEAIVDLMKKTFKIKI